MGQFYRLDREDPSKDGPATADEVREAIKQGATLLEKDKADAKRGTSTPPRRG